MLRIVGIQRNEQPEAEFILLQNHGVMKVCLRGHLLASDDALLDLDPGHMFTFADEEPIPPSAYVALVTGHGANGWRRSADGSPIYHVYWNRPGPVWVQDPGPIHLLNVVHTNRTRSEGLLVGR